MRPVRQQWGRRRGGGFGFGGAGASAATRLTIAVAAASILVAVVGRYLGGGLLGHLVFTPQLVLQGELWQVVTYSLVYPLAGGGIFSFLISLYFLYAIGNQVEAVLGARRFLGFYVGASALAALATIPIAYLFGFQTLPHTGLWVALGALTILFAHHFGDQPVYLMFVLPVRGRQLIYVSFGIVGLFALLQGPASVLPEFLGMLAALAFANGLFRPRRAWLRMRAWHIERTLKRRTRKFSVIDGEKADRGDFGAGGRPTGRQDRWLH